MEFISEVIGGRLRSQVSQSDSVYCAVNSAAYQRAAAQLLIEFPGVELLTQRLLRDAYFDMVLAKLLIIYNHQGISSQVSDDLMKEARVYIRGSMPSKRTSEESIDSIDSIILVLAKTLFDNEKRNSRDIKESRLGKIVIDKPSLLALYAEKGKEYSIQNIGECCRFLRDYAPDTSKGIKEEEILAFSHASLR